MAEKWEYALMAGRAYQSNRDEINFFPIPNGWTEILYLEDPNGSGFEAVSFIKGDQIVISFTGTDPKSLGDLVTDLQLLNGNITVQLLQAAEYYMAVKAANPDATITLTGHSLGGGFAALLGVLFNEAAVTFDQAPFKSAATKSTGAKGSREQRGQVYS